METTSEPGEKPKRAETEVKSAARTVEVLEMLAFEPRPLTLTEIASKLSLPVSSVHQLLKTLVARGWLSVTMPGGGYTIGVRALLTGMTFIERDPVVRATRPALEMLREELGETVHMARLDHNRMVYLVSRESEHQLRTVSRVGQSLPAHATALGKVALAQLGDDEVRSRLIDPLERTTVHTIGTIDELLADLAVTRTRGWAAEREENTLATGCVAVSIPVSAGEYAMSCSVPLSRLTPDRANEIAQTLQFAARTIGGSVSPWGIR